MEHCDPGLEQQKLRKFSSGAAVAACCVQARRRRRRQALIATSAGSVQLRASLAGDVSARVCLVVRSDGLIWPAPKFQSQLGQSQKNCPGGENQRLGWVPAAVQHGRGLEHLCPFP